MSLFLFGFRACYNKYYAPQNVSQEGAALEKLYYSLNRRQQRRLMKIMDQLSDADQQKLSDLFSALSEEDIASLKKLLQEFSQNGQGSSTRLLKGMIKVLLHHDYKPKELSKLIKALGTQNYQDESAQEFLTELFQEVAEEEDPSATAADSKQPAAPDEVPEMDDWKAEIEGVDLPEDSKKKLLATVKQLQTTPEQQRVSASLYTLFSDTPTEGKKRFLTAIAEFEQDKERMTVLRAIATLRSYDKALMARLCAGSYRSSLGNMVQGLRDRLT
ncbi:MAG: hypothetical protein AAFQ08_01655, partial [Bacteroidota bacterium]